MTAPAYTRTAATAVEQAARAEHDFGGWLAAVLATAAARLGSTHALIAGRPGSWEASLVEQLVSGTVGWADDYLSDYAGTGDDPPPADAALTAEQRQVLGQALADALEYRQAATGFCADCDRSEGGLCADHVEDETRATAYLTLAGTLGIPLEDR